MKNLLLIISIVLFSSSIYSTEFRGSEARKIIPESDLVRTNEKNTFPDYILFNENKQFNYSKFSNWVSSYVYSVEKFNSKLISETVDKIGFVHYKYQQFFEGKEIEGAVYTLHTKDSKIISFSGNIYTNINVENSSVLSSENAIQIAKNEMKADLYKWELVSEENQLKKETGNQTSTYFPSPKLILYNVSQIDFCLAYSVVLYSHKPIDKKEFIINASSGKVINVKQRLYSGDVPGTAVTKYSGTQTITTDSYNGSYRLREIGRGNGIETYNAITGTDYAASVDFIDTDNNWNNINAQQDEVATDAHWGTEKTYDYFYINHGRNSIDNNGFKLISYVHYDVDFVNAFWDGYRMTYGDGSGSYTPFTALDICGHEITHGLDENTAGLIYQDESGALNEGFSDIFGTAIEFYAKPTLANWTMGEDIGGALRSMSNPNTYNDPDTYHGINWVTGSADYGGVHTNCTVLSYWFYLVCQGGAGTNDIGNVYSVNGIGIASAQDVAYRMLTVYLTPSSTFEDARFFAIVSAIDIFGPCTPQVETVTNAMYAVGLGTYYIPSVVADFSSPYTAGCSAPFTVNFQNLSNNSSSFLWNFGDGTTSTLVSPSHTYNANGNYNVTLTANGGSCGIDTTIKNSFVSINEANPCLVILPYTGTAATQIACSGKLYDGGGPTGNYADNSDAIITISPVGASSVNLNFISFDIEPGDNGTCNFDYIELFDGPNTSSTSLGKFCNLNGSPGSISSNGGSITLLLHSDQSLNLAGFEVDWFCSLANTAPIAAFSNSAISTCVGNVNFVDQSINGPTSWLWNFGDGTTSTLQNPSHVYLTNGSFNVSLTVTNPYGSDNMTNNALVTVSRPLSPIVLGDTVCVNSTAILNATGNGVIDWFSDAVGGVSLFSGTSFTTPNLITTMTYYAENSVVGLSQYLGPTNNTANGGTNTGQSYLIFDCFSPVTLVSVSVNATSAGNRLIELKNSAGTVLQSATINIPSGVSRITLNFNLPVENDLRLSGPANSGLYRINTTSGATILYPYSIPGILSINSSSAGIGSYYYFFDWEIKQPDCVSIRVPVTAIVENCLSISDNFNSQFQVYPNPIIDFFILNNLIKKEIKSVSLKDILGNEIKIKIITIDDNSLKIETNNISKGVYLFTIITNTGSYYRKIIKE
jgi:Zn-dependent metalloprotease